MLTESRMIASVGLRIFGSSPLSNRISRGPYRTVRRIIFSFDFSTSRGRCTLSKQGTRYPLLELLQIGSEERSQLIEWNEVDAIVKIHVTRARNNDQFLGLSR
jgi:hypothetical protein